jgi:hypothetical protein
MATKFNNELEWMQKEVPVVLFDIFLARRRINKVDISQGSQCSGHAHNLSPPVHKSGVLPHEPTAATIIY